MLNEHAVARSHPVHGQRRMAAMNVNAASANSAKAGQTQGQINLSLNAPLASWKPQQKLLVRK